MKWIWVLILLISAACTGQPAAENAKPTPVDDEAIARFMASAPSKQQNRATVTRLPQSAPSSTAGLPLPAVDPLQVIGDFAIAGSVTIIPMTRAVYSRFIHEGYSGVVKIQEMGTTSGFQVYCETGESDIALALRPILQAELDACLNRGRAPVALQVGVNPIVVVVNPANTSVTDVSLAQLTQIFTAARWSDIDPSWPAQNILRYVPNQTFGSFSYFVDLVLSNDAQALEKAPFTTLSTDQADLAHGIAENANAVGFIDYPFYVANANGLKLVTIDGVKPDAVTTNNGAYPLVNPLLLYIDPVTLQTKPQVGAFLTFYLTHLDEVLTEAHELPVNVQTLDRTKISLEQAMDNENYLNEISQLLKRTPTSTPSPTLAPTLQPTLSLTQTPPATNTPSK